MSSDSEYEYASDDSMDYYDDEIYFEEDLNRPKNNKRPHEEMSKLYQLMFWKRFCSKTILWIKKVSLEFKVCNRIVCIIPTLKKTVHSIVLNTKLTMYLF